jgi:hypothetical protein
LSFLITWCLLLLLLTAEFDLLEPIVACIFVYYLFIYLYTYMHINIDLFIISNRTPWAYPTVLDKLSEVLTVIETVLC